MSKSTKIIIFSLIFLITTALTNAQDCGFYIPLEVGKGMQFQNFNNRDRLQSSQDVIVKSIERKDGMLTAVMNTTAYDQRNREQHQAAFNVSCSGNELSIDLQSVLDPNMLAGFKGMEIQMESSGMIIPTNLSAGQSLPDAQLNMKVLTGNVTFSDITLSISNRKVESRETIEVPAGTFDCFKVSYDLEIVTRTMGIPITARSKTIEYHAAGQGVVRSENYDSRDRMQGYTVLSKVY